MKRRRNLLPVIISLAVIGLVATFLAARLGGSAETAPEAPTPRAAFVEAPETQAVPERLLQQQHAIEQDLRAIQAYLEDEQAVRRGDLNKSEQLPLEEYEAQKEPESVLSKKRGDVALRSP
jgi:hypothetical protein